MPRYNNEDLYGQQTSLLNDVNKYMSANTANVGGKPSTSSNPYGFDLSALDNLTNSGWNMGNATGGALFDNGSNLDLDLGGGFKKVAPDPDDNDPDPDDKRDRTPPPTGGGNNPLLTKFIGELQVLDKDQRDLLLGFVSGGGGDKIAGVSSTEYAELFGVSDDYASRFQGFPGLSNLVDEIQNVYNFSNQQRGYEQRAAQEAQRASKGGKFQGGMGFAGFGARKNPMQRRSLMDTLSQRQDSVAEATAGKYGQILNTLASQLTGGFNIANNILQENPSAENQTGPPSEGEERYFSGQNWIFIGGTWIEAESYWADKQAEG